MVCRRFSVTGRVQGVFFRGATQDEARRLQLSGWARNCADGSVEVFACGDDAALARLETWLRQGPPMAQVNGVVVEQAADAPCEGFEIRYA